VRFEPVTPSADERDLLLRFLERQRQEVVATAQGLTDEQGRWTPEGRLLPITGIINHLTFVERRWIDGRYLQLELPPRREEFRGGDPSLATVVRGYRDRARRTEEIVRSAPSLAVHCLGQEHHSPPAHILLGLQQPVDLQWVLLHLIEETAHHAGHADATREMLDGEKTRA
jgi:hypothetical protein